MVKISILFLHLTNTNKVKLETKKNTCRNKVDK